MRFVSGDAEADQVAVPKTAQLVAARLRRQIINGELKEGDVLPTEAVLMERFGIARPTLREAFRILEAESLLSIRRGRPGARVQLPSREVAARYAGLVLQAENTPIQDVFEARLQLEPASARMLANTATRKTLAVLREALDAEEAALDDDIAFSDAGARFHKEVVALAGNRTLALFADMMESIVASGNREVIREAGSGPDQHRIAHRAHERLYKFIEANSPDEAEDHWRAHLEAVHQLYLRRLGRNRTVDLLP